MPKKLMRVLFGNKNINNILIQTKIYIKNYINFLNRNRIRKSEQNLKPVAEIREIEESGDRSDQINDLKESVQKLRRLVFGFRQLIIYWT